MRAFIKREQNIIQLPEDFANLSTIDNSSYNYKVIYYIDPLKAFSSKALKTEIYVSLSPIQIQKFNVFDNSDSDQVLTNLLIKTQKQKDKMRASDAFNSKVYVPKITSDITKFISNGLYVDFSPKNRNQDTVIKTQRSIKPQLIAELLGAKNSVPLLEQNNNKVEFIDQSIDSSEIRRMATSLLFQKKIDPASFVGKRSNTILSAKHAYSGTISKKTSTDVYEQEELLRTSLLSSIDTSDANTRSDAVQNVPVVANIKHIVAEENFSIPVEYLDSEEFYFVFRIKNDKGIIVQTISGLVNHGKQVAAQKMPTLPPIILAPKKTYFGENVINLKQVDPNASSIQLYKKRFTYSQSIKDASYSLVGEVKAKSNESFVKIVDYASSTEPVVYRAIPVSSTGMLGAEFTSVVIETVRGQVAKTSPVNQIPSFVSIASQVTSDGIILNIKDIPPEPIAFIVRKRNLSLRQTSYIDIGSPRLIESFDSSSIEIQDTGVSQGHIYEYVVALIYKTGKIQNSTNSHLVNFSPIKSNILDLSLGEATIEELGGNEIDVKFTINKSIIPKDADHVKAFLTSQGFLGEFQEDIIENKEALGNLFAIGVKRHNLSTGEVEDFGIINSDSSFSDVQFGSSKGVQPLQAGFEYKYTVTAYARNIETLFPNLEKTDNTNSNLPYTYLPSEWQHPVTLLEGNLVTSKTLKRNHAKSEFEFGNIADTKDITISLASVLPSLYESKAKAIKNNKSVLIQWKVQGNVKSIDHFIVVLDISGIKTIVGKCHNISNSNYFQFVDSLDNKESGGLTYFIIPVYFDFSRGVEIKSNQVMI